MYYLPKLLIYLPIIYLPTSLQLFIYLLIYLSTYLLSTYIPTYILHK